MSGWRGESASYGAITPGQAGGGGSRPSRFRRGSVRVLRAGPYATGGGRVPSSAEALQGYGGCGGPGPGAFIGLVSRET